MISSIETLSATSEFSEELWETFEPPESINLPETNEKEWGFFLKDSSLRNLERRNVGYFITATALSLPRDLQ